MYNHRLITLSFAVGEIMCAHTRIEWVLCLDKMLVFKYAGSVYTNSQKQYLNWKKLSHKSKYFPFQYFSFISGQNLNFARHFKT